MSESDEKFARPDSARNRRKLVGVLAGSALASGGWTVPIVKGILLPAHAATSQVSADNGAIPMDDQGISFAGNIDALLPGGMRPTLVDANPLSGAVNLAGHNQPDALDWFISPAKANGTVSHIDIRIDEENQMMSFQYQDNADYNSNTSEQLEFGQFTMGSNCSDTVLEIDFVSYSAAGAVIRVGFGVFPDTFTTVTIPPGQSGFAYGCINFPDIPDFV